ncbi:hypothetical protein EIP86_000159 [Pleurotus ostreatoroseus]|nr:hypothetical protein EIP86_000159 [Pleurotus ostreatoroseus]
MATFGDLPLDLLDRVLMYLPDFNTLSSVLKTCKSIYGVFQAHPKSIVQAIAFNIVGPALPEAVRLIAYEQDSSPAEDDSEDGSVPPFSRSDTVILSDNASVVSRLEALYSMSNKDRTAASSTLTDAESARFTRAMYRLWEVLYLLLRDLNDEEIEAMDKAQEEAEEEGEDEEDPGHADLIARRSTNIRRYLNRFQNQELFEVDAVAYLLRDVVCWTDKATNDTWGELWRASSSTVELTIGVSANVYLARPDEILNKWLTERHGWTPHHQGLSFSLPWTTLGDVLRSVFSGRHIDEAKRDAEVPKAILEQTVGQHDLCHRCYNSSRLWGKTNFSLFRGWMTKREICAALKGQLPRNTFETTALQQHLTSRDSRGEVNFDWNRMFEELCETSSGEPVDSVWDKEHYYCKDCIETLFRARLTAWWAAEKRRAPGAEVLTDCWYGYACRTQTHRAAHAQKLNHLCTPTRGDGYVPKGAGDDTA